LYLKLLCEYLVVLRWTTNTIVRDLGGGPDLILSGFLPGFLWFPTTLHVEYCYRF